GTGPATIATIFAKAASANFNVVYFQVRTAGDALYAPRSVDPLEPCSPRLCGTLGGALPYDPLAVALTEAGKYGIEVHAWLNSNTAWIAGSATACNQLLPTALPKHIAIAHPEYLMVDSAGNRQPCATTSEYIWMSPGWSAVRSRLAAVAADVSRRYGPLGLRGIHLDRIRYPGRTWSYDTASVNGYKRAYNTNTVPRTNNPNWMSFRREQVNLEVKEVADSVRAIDPTMVISAAVWPIHKNMPGWPVFSSGYDDYMQDPPTWAKGGYLDVAAPMTYPATSGSVSYLIKPTECASLDWTCLFKYHVRAIEDTAHRHVYIGVTAIRGAGDMTAEIKKARELHATGMSVYSYSLVDSFNGWSVLANDLFKYKAVVPPRPWMPARQ
ncbi:MAG TPA: family 10 glycosylhydrolase, partial [Gemmatimonadaceae bacterium]|nr:family 10 glycosylhydrolase [Gemmatimonadaceae bacterium]